ncbi:MAG: NfeD family protein [Clostridia bacterium]|jgi:membrane protein implicated in regulation of membrane protease activity|nr:NfeD family protein [Clostridia bacterium]
MWQIWLILSGLFLVLEIVTVGFLVFWFAIGAFIAMLVSFFTENAIIQTLVFLISSTALLFITKPFVNKVTFKDSSVKTNAFKIEGKLAKVIKDIDPIEGKGQIKINGEIWSAKSYNDTYISTDTDVIIEKLDGVKALVKPLASNNK